MIASSLAPSNSTKTVELPWDQESPRSQMLQTLSTFILQDPFVTSDHVDYSLLKGWLLWFLWWCYLLVFLLHLNTYHDSLIFWLLCPCAPYECWCSPKFVLWFSSLGTPHSPRGFIHVHGCNHSLYNGSSQISVANPDPIWIQNIYPVCFLHLSVWACNKNFKFHKPDGYNVARLDLSIQQDMVLHLFKFPWFLPIKKYLVVFFTWVLYISVSVYF